MTPGEPHPFRWCGIQLYMGQLQLDVFGANPPSCARQTGQLLRSPCTRAGSQAKLWDTLKAAPSMLVRSWVWRSSAYCYASMELPMMCHWGHTVRYPMTLYATSRVATSTRPSNLQLAYMVQNLVLVRMMSVLAASVPLAPWHFSAAVLTEVASTS